MDELRQVGVAPTDPGLIVALEGAALPTDDLAQSPGHFFRFETNGIAVGYGGFERFGADALLRSIVVLPDARGRGAGRAITQALLAELHGEDVAQAYLLTTTAEAFFSHLGFAIISREVAPATILATPQASRICSSAALLSRATA
jgi:N-acetylglutamate synthase-like GNAT family acetyltransferase